VQEALSLRCRLGPLWRLFAPPGFKSSLEVINVFIEGLIDLAYSRPEKEDDTKGTALLATEDRKTLRDQLVNILLPAKDSIAAALSWLFYELSYHPTVYAKLRQEVLEIVGQEGRPSVADLQRMKYMQHCLNEGISHLNKRN
jgi:cytochrome P450